MLDVTEKQGIYEAHNSFTWKFKNPYQTKIFNYTVDILLSIGDKVVNESEIIILPVYNVSTKRLSNRSLILRLEFDLE